MEKSPVLLCCTVKDIVYPSVGVNRLFCDFTLVGLVLALHPSAMAVIAPDVIAQLSSVGVIVGYVEFGTVTTEPPKTIWVNALGSVTVPIMLPEPHQSPVQIHVLVPELVRVIVAWTGSLLSPAPRIVRLSISRSVVLVAIRPNAFPDLFIKLLYPEV